jgi:hypothetical protein
MAHKYLELYWIVDKHFEMNRKWSKYQVYPEYDRPIQLVMYEDLILD